MSSFHTEILIWIIDGQKSLFTVKCDKVYIHIHIISILDIYIVFFIVIFVINTYPILACVQAPIPILGYALGAMYTDIK